MVVITAEKLLSLNPASISAMSRSEVDALCIALADRCRDLLEKLNKNSQHSSISPGNFVSGRTAANDTVSAHPSNLSKERQPQEATPKLRKKREQGFGPTVKLPMTETIHLYPLACKSFQHNFCDTGSLHAKCYTAFFQLDLVLSATGLGRAERALRHWVILRKVTQGTRTSIGNKTMAILASITATCKLSAMNIIDFLKDIVIAARVGTEMPAFEALKVGQGCEHYYLYRKTYS